jgi:hypothetical protein
MAIVAASLGCADATLPASATATAGTTNGTSSHWAYQPLIRPAVPNAPGTSGNPVDRFLRERLQREGLRPSAPASAEVWLRRVTYDLTGLPPTPSERVSFLADSSADARSRVVDRLLASPRYGERWARHWMDAVHFAETHGHDQDRIRTNAWPYRDYLVRAFNSDRPYTRFVEEQIAADQLFPREPELIPALGLAAAGPWDESSLRCIREDASDRQAARYIDRDDMVTTVMQTFTSTTVQCARCHDHKFDPVSQRDYYALQAVFAGVERANRLFDTDPDRHALRQQLRAALHQVRSTSGTNAPAWLTPEVQDEVRRWESARAAAEALWKPLARVTPSSTSGSTLTAGEGGIVVASGLRPERDDYQVIANPEGLASPIRSIRLQVLADPSLPQGGPGRQDNGNFHLTEFEVWNGSKRIELARAKADFNQDGWGISAALDGDEKTAWGIHPEEGKSHVAGFELKAPLSLKAGESLRIVLKQRHGGGHLIGRFRLSISDRPLTEATQPLASSLEQTLATAPARRSPSQILELARHIVTRRLESRLDSLPAPHLVYAPAADFDPDGGLKPVFQPRPVSVLKRGEFDHPLEPALPGTLSCVAGLPSRFAVSPDAPEGERRAALARWITDRGNALAWRSIANRVWHLHFGRGLVETPNDFGRMGSGPSHPELLDWLAVWFRDDAQGSFKALHRLLVLSDTYAQSSRVTDSDPQAATRDAGNVLLWRMNRTRLDAEAVRDTMFQVSGRLDFRMGGPGDRQFDLKPGIHVTPMVDYAKFDRDSEAAGRRSLYRFLFRTLPDPFMDALDCPAGDQLTPVRTSGITVQQALALWNDELVLRQSGHFAATLQREFPGADESVRIRAAVERTFARPATADETRLLTQYASRHGLAAACRLLFNSNEFIFVD